MSTTTDFDPPKALDSETTIVSCMFAKPEDAITALESLKPDDFFSVFNANVFEAIGKCHANGRSIDLLTVHNELANSGKADQNSMTALCAFTEQ